ncbi:unnamed protein product [Adineta steineri]|uniref:Sacsin/Nov domain-containing protein n=1 Tax=Adineta steineri TaxID=433720 RepID=A0A815PGT5_9BILA|nr:unnamed protein product [Adineta steineri]CAF1449448.1 unnamed protein product [Adineta steineri]
MAEILNYNDRQSNGLRNGQLHEVRVNQRKMIDNIFTQYSSDFVVCREVIQNADDARATSFHLQIKCDAPYSSLPKEKEFDNRTITEFRMINNGKIFSETDWKRVATIAEGNTDPQSVGQFGVGFFSVFSYTNEPMITSGKEYMKFVWKGDQLFYEHDKLSIQQQSNETSIILNMRNKCILCIESNLNSSKETKEVMSTINLTELKAYFAKVLSFTRHIVNLVITINSLTVFQVSKKKYDNPSIQNTFTFKPQSSIHHMLHINSFVVTEQIITIDNTASIVLGHITVEASVNVDQQFHNYIERTLKRLPSSIKIQILFVPIDTIINQQQLQSSLVDKNLNSQILERILPLKFLDNEIIPSGFIFIGLGTHQSIGIGMHVYSHFIPTVERQELNLQDPYIAKWNKELLATVGQIARCFYDQTINHSSHNRSDVYYNALIKSYSFQPTTPNEKVGIIVRSGFFASRNNILVPVKQTSTAKHLSLLPSAQAFLADSKYIHEFLSLPLVPFELARNHFFTILKEYQLINIVNKSIIETQLISSILLFNELIALLQWLCIHGINDRSYAKRILLIVRFQETINSPISFFKQINCYDASNISSILPLPLNVLPVSIAGHFSEEQLRHHLFLIPCTFKDLMEFYLHENQHYLFYDSKTATRLLSNLSKYSSHFSQSKWLEVKKILSDLKCIPTTEGMKLPNESYIPSHMLTPDSPAITLNILPDKTKTKNQTNINNSDENLVSTYFLKQIGCRMLNIQSIIKYWQMNSNNISELNQENIQTLIETLMKERKYMTDEDFKALKQSQFLQGTTLQSTDRIKQQYFPHDLHFPSIAKDLNWNDLIILDWDDIDPHSSEFAFLKELGVRDIPDLHNLINRIIVEYNDKQHKLPIALQFFAKKFQKYYSTTWKINDIQQAFLPSCLPTKTNSNNNIILSTPNKVFLKSNPLYATLLPEVVKLFEKYHIIPLLGIKEQPTLTQAFDTVIERKTELLTINSAGEIFAYLNGLEGLNQTFIKHLSNIAFIPLHGVSTLMKPSQIFIQHATSSASTELDMSGLIDYVDYGSEGNSFLLTIGVRHFPPIPKLVEILLERQANYFSNLKDNETILKQKINTYINCLKRIARVSAEIPEFHNEPLERRLKTEPWCLGFQRIDSNESKTMYFYRIVKPTEIYLNDDPQCELHHRPICSNEPELNKLYKQFGAKWLSECVTRELVPTGKPISTDQSNELKNIIQQRLNILFVDKQGVPLADLNKQHFQLLEKNLSVFEIKDIRCRLTFQNVTKVLDSINSSSCTLQQKQNEVILYLRQDLSTSNYDYLDIARELAQFVFKAPSESVIDTIYKRLSLSLESLERHGLPVTTLLKNRSQDLLSPQEEPVVRSKKIPSLLAGALGIFGRLGRSNKKKDPINHGIQSKEPDHDEYPINHEIQSKELDPAKDPMNHNIQSKEPGYTKDSNNHGIQLKELDRAKDSVEKDDQPVDPSRVKTTHTSHDHTRNVVPDVQQRDNHTSTIARHPIEDFKRGKVPMKRILRGLVQQSQAYPESTINHKGYIRNEHHESCEVIPDINMKIYPSADIPIPLFIEEDVIVTSKMINQAQQLSYVLTNLAQYVFELSIEALHLFRDINGDRIAFNKNGALFFNLRYFEQIYADELQTYLQQPTTSDRIVNTILNFYFMVTCHELVHNINPNHDLNFINNLQECATECMIQKELTLANFSFNALKSNVSTRF